MRALDFLAGGGQSRSYNLGNGTPTSVRQVIDAGQQAVIGVNKYRVDADEAIDGVLTLGPTGATPAIEALDAVGRDIPLATFDLSSDVLEAIAAGEMLFAIDSQQYLQGYLPIVLLTLRAENLNTIANPVLMTGPGFVTQENAAEVIELTAAGTR